MITILFVVPDRGPYQFELPAVPAIGDTVIVFREERKVMHVVWDLQASDDRITVYLGERR